MSAKFDTQCEALSTSRLSSPTGYASQSHATLDPKVVWRGNVIAAAQVAAGKAFAVRQLSRNTWCKTIGALHKREVLHENGTSYATDGMLRKKKRAGDIFLPFNAPLPRPFSHDHEYMAPGARGAGIGAGKRLSHPQEVCKIQRKDVGPMFSANAYRQSLPTLAEKWTERGTLPFYRAVDGARCAR